MCLSVQYPYSFFRGSILVVIQQDTVAAMCWIPYVAKETKFGILLQATLLEVCNHSNCICFFAHQAINTWLFCKMVSIMNVLEPFGLMQGRRHKILSLLFHSELCSNHVLPIQNKSQLAALKSINLNHAMDRKTSGHNMVWLPAFAPLAQTGHLVTTNVTPKKRNGRNSVLKFFHSD